MKDEVEEFLRRVAQMRAQAEAQAKGQQPRQAPQRPPPKQPRTPPVARLAPAAPPVAAPLNVEIVDAELADTADRLAQRVSRDFHESEEIAQHTRQLGAEVDAADTKMQAHLHQVFDHKLGQLKTSSGAGELVADRSAADVSLDQIRRMLRSPQSVRDAIIMSEVLRRPEI